MRISFPRPARPGRRGAIGLACLLAAALLTGCGDERLRLRVLTYNIHHGEGTDRRFDLPRIAKVIGSARPDLVALQEVDVGTRRAKGVDQAKELARRTKMHAAFGKAMNFADGQYGVAVLSRWPIRQSRTHALGADPGKEPRAALAVTVRPGGKPAEVTFISTHLDHRPKSALRLRQAKKLNELVATPATGPAVLAGDLNDVPGSPALKELLRHWDPATGPQAPPTCPADKPRVKIDYVLTRPQGVWRVVETKVLGEKIASDHRPFLAVLEWAASPPR